MGPSNCWAYPNPIMQPAVRLITAITNSNPAVVTTSFAHLYSTGLIVRLVLPTVAIQTNVDGQVVFTYMMPEINNMVGTIAVLSPTTFSIDINSTLFTPFVIPVNPSPHTPTCSYVVPVGEIAETVMYAVQNTLPF